MSRHLTASALLLAIARPALAHGGSMSNTEASVLVGVLLVAAPVGAIVLALMFFRLIAAVFMSPRERGETKQSADGMS